MSVQIHINGKNAAEAVKELSALASHFGGQAVQAPVSAPIQQAPAQQTPIQQPPVVTAPPAQAAQAYSQQAAYTPQTVPTQTFAAPTQPTAVPTAAAPTYTLDQLGVAAGPLVDAGRSPELTAWINQRGAGALNQLDPALYGEFATFLRSLGAKI